MCDSNPCGAFGRSQLTCRPGAHVVVSSTPLECSKTINYIQPKPLHSKYFPLLFYSQICALRSSECIKNVKYSKEFFLLKTKGYLQYFNQNVTLVLENKKTETSYVRGEGTGI
jgi:hypothetical protein